MMFDVTVKQCQAELGAEPHSEACCPIRRSHKLQTADKQTTACRAQTSEKSKKLRKAAEKHSTQQRSVCLSEKSSEACSDLSERRCSSSSALWNLYMFSGTKTTDQFRLVQPQFALWSDGTTESSWILCWFKRMTSCSADTSLTNTQRYSDCCFHHASSSRLRSLLLLLSSDIIILCLSFPFSRSFISEENNTCYFNGLI